MEYADIDSSDEREEGEIFDDDLEEISDGSIAPSPKTGKLNSPEENLRAISLSSVSDLEVSGLSSVYHSNPKLPSKREGRKRKKLLRHHHRRSSDSSSEDEEMMKTKRLLKDAIRRDQEEMHNNSLRTRLKKMVEDSTPHDIDIDPPNICDNNQHAPKPLETNPMLNGGEEEKKESFETDMSPCLPLDVDDELIQLRLDALKTAVINKFQRKKRKLRLNGQEETKVLEINKENSSDNVNTQSCKAETCTEEITETNPVVVNNITPVSAINSEDEDEDILRAVLLASMAKKITNKVSPQNQKKKHDGSNLSVPKKKQTKIAQVAKKPNIDLPKIQPIIISINNPDSDSDDVFNDQDCVEELKNENLLDKRQLELKIDNFLKQQRAEVEAKSKVVNTSNTSQTSNGVNSQTKKNVELNNLYKLLPESKQLEYETLIKKLNNAQKKPKLKRLSSRICDNKIQKSKISLSTTEGNSSTSKSNLSESSQMQLKLVQHQVSGRLQEKGKYSALSPLLDKLDRVNQEQKKHEIRIKNLMKQLNEAKSRSTKLQKIFDNAMQEFLKKKEEIDSKPMAVPPTKPKVNSTSNLMLKNNINLPKLAKPAPTKTTITNTSSNSVHCKVVLEKCPVDIEDPNDIEFKTLTNVETSDMPKYSSPLDYMGSKNNKILNPMEILCPYEMDGLCRDKDCVYNHCR